MENAVNLIGFVVGLIGVVVGSIIGYYTKKRVNSGSINTTDASVLWTHLNNALTRSDSRIAYLESEVERLSEEARESRGHLEEAKKREEKCHQQQLALIERMEALQKSLVKRGNDAISDN